MQVSSRLALVVGLLIAVASVAAQERQQPRNAPSPRLISGTVLDASSDAPLRRVRVSPSDRGAEDAYTNEQGQFEVRADAGSLRLVKPGYVPLTITRDELAENTGPLRISLVRGAAVGGTVFEPNGFPAAGVRVRVRRLTEETGRGRGQQYQAQTDDRGEFRVGNLPEGRYEVDAAGGARGRGARGGGRGGRGRQSEPAPQGVVVEVRPGQESAVALVLEPSLNPRPQPPRPAPNVPAERAASIAGRVLSSEGRPLEGATVTLIAVGGGAQRAPGAVTDANGQYTITGVPAGTYRLRATRSGYTGVEYGQTRALQQGRTLRLTARSRLDDIHVTLPRGSAITGRIIDPWGEPLEDVEIQVMQERFLNGRMRLVPAAGGQGGRTDDRGRYRVYGLLPGTYYVVATDRANRSRSGEDDETGAVFYPGTPHLTEALPVTLDIGRDGIGLDMVFGPVPGVTVRGSARSSAGSPIRGRAVLGVSARYGAPLLPLQTAGLDAEGAFEFRNVGPGDYVVQVVGVSADALEASRALNRGARGGRRGGGGRGRAARGTGNAADELLRNAVEAAMQREFGAQYVAVSASDVDFVTVNTSPGSTVAGELVLEGSSADVSPTSFTLTALPADLDQTPLTGENPPRANIAEDGTFEIRGITGPARFALTRAPSGWWLKSVDVNGVNAALYPASFGRPEQSMRSVKVVVATGAGRIDGQVRNARNEPVSDFAAVVFPSDQERWFSGSPYLAFATGAQDGTFSVSRLPPGEYRVVAVDRIDGGADGGEWQRPEVLSALLPLSERIEVGKGQPVTAELRLVRRGG